MTIDEGWVMKMSVAGAPVTEKAVLVAWIEPNVATNV